MCFAMFVLKHPGNCSFPLCNSSDFQLWLELLSVFLISKKNCNQTVYSITIFIFQPLWLKVQNSTISIFFFFFFWGGTLFSIVCTRVSSIILKVNISYSNVEQQNIFLVSQSAENICISVLSAATITLMAGLNLIKLQIIGKLLIYI